MFRMKTPDLQHFLHNPARIAIKFHKIISLILSTHKSLILIIGMISEIKITQGFCNNKIKEVKRHKYILKT